MYSTLNSFSHKSNNSVSNPLSHLKFVLAFANKFQLHWNNAKICVYNHWFLLQIWYKSNVTKLQYIHEKIRKGRSLILAWRQTNGSSIDLKLKFNDIRNWLFFMEFLKIYLDIERVQLSQNPFKSRQINREMIWAPSFE